MTSMPARSWSRMASCVASSKVSLVSVCPYSPALILSSAVQNQPGKPWLPMTCVGRIGSVAAIVCPFSEEMFLDLAHGGAREGIPELDDLRDLERRQPGAAPRDEIAGRDGRALVEDDVRLDCLVTHRIGNPDDRGVEHG